MGAASLEETNARSCNMLQLFTNYKRNEIPGEPNVKVNNNYYSPITPFLFLFCSTNIWPLSFYYTSV